SRRLLHANLISDEHGFALAQHGIRVLVARRTTATRSGRPLGTMAGYGRTLPIPNRGCRVLVFHAALVIQGIKWEWARPFRCHHVCKYAKQRLRTASLVQEVHSEREWNRPRERCRLIGSQFRQPI